MKTVKEAATDYANEHCINGEWLGTRNTFIDGVQFAQRWISVEDELPPCSDRDILIKGIDDRGHDGIVDIGYMHESIPRVENFVSLGGILTKVTHWRQIELKQ
jgi:hypothetical protein